MQRGLLHWALIVPMIAPFVIFFVVVMSLSGIVHLLFGKKTVDKIFQFLDKNLPIEEGTYFGWCFFQFGDNPQPIKLGWLKNLLTHKYVSMGWSLGIIIPHVLLVVSSILLCVLANGLVFVTEYIMDQVIKLDEFKLLGDAYDRWSFQ